jgi:hypothetical protein
MQMRRNPEPDDKRRRGAAYEKFELSIGGVIVFVVALLIAAVAMHAALWDWWRNIGGEKTAARFWSPASEARSGEGRFTPQLQLAPATDWKSYRREQQTLLESYGWEDRSNGIVRIPIDQAIDRVIAHGLPKWGSSNQSLSLLQMQTGRAAGERELKQ